MQEKKCIFAKIFFYMTTVELKELIDEDILYNLIQYCELNNISFDIINKMLKDSLTVMKYGDKPPMFNSSNNKVSYKEVIMDKSDKIHENIEIENEKSNVVLVDTPLELPDVVPVFTEEIPKKRKRTLNVK